MFEEHKHLPSKTWGGSELEKHFFCSSLHAMRGEVLGCWLGHVCCVHALPRFSAVRAGAERRIKALCGAGILKTSAGRQLLEAHCCPDLMDWLAQENLWCSLDLKCDPVSYRRVESRGDRKNIDQDAGVWSEPFKYLKYVACTTQGLLFVFGFGTDMLGVLLQEGH